MFERLSWLITGSSRPGKTHNVPDASGSSPLLDLLQPLYSSSVEQGAWGFMPVLDRDSPQGKGLYNLMHPEPKPEPKHPGHSEKSREVEPQGEEETAKAPAIKKWKNPGQPDLVLRHVWAAEAKTLTFVKTHTSIPTLLVQCFKMEGQYFVVEVDIDLFQREGSSIQPLSSIVSRYKVASEIDASNPLETAARQAAQYIIELRKIADSTLDPTPPVLPLVRSIEDGPWLVPDHLSLRSEYYPKDRNAEHFIAPCTSLFLHRVLDHCQLAFPSQIRSPEEAYTDDDHKEDDFIKLRVYSRSSRELKSALEQQQPWIHPLRFSHGDMTADNIIIDKQGTIVAITGWKSAGWLPEYWEYASVKVHSGDFGKRLRSGKVEYEKGVWEKWWKIWLDQVAQGDADWRKCLEQLDTAIYHASFEFLSRERRLGGKKGGYYFINVDATVLASKLLTGEELRILKEQPFVNDLYNYEIYRPGPP